MVTGGRRRGKGLKLSQGKLGQGVRQGFVTERRVVGRWDELLGEVGTAQNLLGFKKCPDNAFGYTAWCLGIRVLLDIWFNSCV